MRKMRWMLVLGMSMLLAAGGWAVRPVSANTTVALVVDDEFVSADIPPEIYQGRVMVPLRWVSEALGSRVTWDSTNKIATVDTEFTPEKTGSGIQVWVKGERLPSDTPMLIRQGRLLVPARFIAERLGGTVEWEPREQTVYFRFSSYRGPNEWETVKIDQLSGMQFVQPAGWGFSRSYGSPSSDDKQKQLDHSLDEMLAALKEGKRIRPRELAEPVRRVYFNLQEYRDSEGNQHYGGQLELSLSGQYAKLVWQGELSRPVFLHFANDRMIGALDEAEQWLPAPFPVQPVKTTTLPQAWIDAGVVKLSPVAHGELPFAPGDPVYKNSASGEWNALHYAYADNAAQLWASPDGINWHRDQGGNFGELAPMAIGMLPDDAGTLLLTNAADSGIYRAERGKSGVVQEWKQVWAYPLPEAAFQYPPIRYIPDPAAPGRVYTSFAHDTRSFLTNGLFMSEDSGLSWFESGINGTSDERFAWPDPPLPDPEEPGTVYVEAGVWVIADQYYGGLQSVFVSRDAGRNWVQLEGVDTLYGFSEDAEGAVLVAARHGTTASVLLTSRDHGATWLERKLPFRISDLKVDPGDPNTLIVSAFAASQFAYYGSSDSGATWQRVESPGKPIENWLPELDLFYARGENGTEIYKISR